MLALVAVLCCASEGAAQRLPERLRPIRPPAADSVRVYAPSYCSTSTVGDTLKNLSG
jgi:hypothetical protein